MGRRVHAAVFVVAVPLVIVAIALATRARYDAVWHSALTDQFGSLTAQQLARVALPIVCSDPTLSVDVPICGEYVAMSWVLVGAAASALVGLGLITLIALSGSRARVDRRALLRWFRPMLYLTVVVSIGLVVLDGILAVVVLFAGMDAFLNGVWLGIVAAPAIALLVAGLGMVRALRAATGGARVSAIALPIAPDAEPRLFSFILATSDTLGIDPPANVIAGLEPNFYVTEVDVEAPSGTLGGRTMYLSLPLCRTLSVAELRAVIGHELGHFVGEDTAWSTRFYPLYRGSIEAVVAVEHGGRGFGSLSTAPAAAILGLFLSEFAANESAIGRDRELAADQTGARLTSPLTMATVLAKIALRAQAWPKTVADAARTIGDGGEVPNLSTAFSASAFEPLAETDLAVLDTAAIAHPTDSHPPLSARLAALKVSAGEATRNALETAPAEPGAQLFDHAEALEEALTEILVAAIAPEAQAISAARRRQEAARAWVSDFEARGDPEG